ncbi:unnamed protein product [Polarella glacialis]|uniref:C2 domain-containing protein n=1 Tax=Polarella glacialis TaxID=89957 RepID=A0A813GTF8_POLGL|nr:unnamed protein product [Polarella glacialis]
MGWRSDAAAAADYAEHPIESFLSGAFPVEIQSKDDFHTERWRCIYDPVRAAETLSPHARLEVGIIRGRSLLAADRSLVSRPTSDPYVKVLLDDRPVFSTAHRAATLEPEWQEVTSLDIVAARSMVRLQIMDKDRWKEDDPIGFVEFCVGDLPFDELVEGWLELRFQENLQRTSTSRYRNHCAARDDALREVWAQSSAGRPPSWGQLKEKRLKNKSSCRSILTQLTASPGSAELYNAGEIFVRLRLFPVVSAQDCTFALALDPPVPVDFGTYVQEENLVKLDVQDLFDDLMDIKRSFVDDGLVCILNFCRYVLNWRSVPISLVYTAGALVICLRPWDLFIPVVFALLAVSVCLLALGQLARQLTTGGSNAPLTEDGFQDVARWRDTPQMAAFLMRLVEQDLHGKVADDRQLLLLARLCINGSWPLAPLGKVRQILWKADWVTCPKDQDLPEAFRPGALVLVDERRRARVLHLDTVPGSAVVEYESETYQRDEVFRVRTEAVPLQRIVLRPELPRIPAWILPGPIECKIRRFHTQVEIFKLDILPLWQAVGNVLTWRRREQAVWLAASCLGISLGTMALSCYGHTAVGRLLWIRDWLCTCLCLAVVMPPFLCKAWWFDVLRSALRIALRRKQERRAPEVWAFFTALPEEAQGTGFASPVDSSPLLPQSAPERLDFLGQSLGQQLCLRAAGLGPFWSTCR